VNRRVEIASRPLWRVRWLARAPKLALGLLVGVLTLAGLRSVIAGPPAAPSPRATSPAPDVAAEGFAEAFSRAYLTWHASTGEEQERRVAGFVSNSLEPGAGFVPPSKGGEAVRWTAVIQDTTTGRRSRLVTVAVETTRRSAYLAVPVSRDAHGSLFVAAYPAFVGGPAVATSAAAADEDEIEDGRLRAVVERALRNYLERQPQDLRADLAPDAVVSLPPETLLLQSVDQVTRARPGVVACTVSARDQHGAELRLRYELSVVRRDRFYVRSIATDPTKGGPS
jgi:hypothetical protein